MFLKFQNAPAVIEIPRCETLLATLRKAAQGWHFDEVSEGPATTRVVRRGDAYEIFSPGYDPIEAGPVGAACCIAVDVVDAMIEAEPERLWLHCGSVLINGRLVVFPSHSHAGKSTLIGRLAADGHKVFGDDMLALTPDDAGGVGLGIAPRLRLPLPQSASSGFRAFVDAHRGSADHRYLYLDLPDGKLATHGQTAPLGAVVILDRQDGARAQFGTAEPALVLQMLANQNFVSGTRGADLLARLHRMVERLPCVTLRYSDLDEAAEAIASMFREWPLPAERLSKLPGLGRPGLVRSGDEDALRVATSRRQGIPPRRRPLRRKDGVGLREVGGELFLAGEDGPTIYHLNPVGAGIWNLLEEPLSRAQIVEILSGAFPQVAPIVLERDAAELIEDLIAAELISPVP